MSAPTRRIEPLRRPPDAVVAVPGSKSLTNRALVCAALAAGTSTLTGVLVADDTEAMLECLVRLGARASLDEVAREVVVAGTAGVPGRGAIDLDARLSGTTSRFVTPLLPLGAGSYRLDGAEPLRRRPLGDLIDALGRLGASITADGEPGHLPVTVHGGAPLGDRVTVRGDTSSQFLSALMLGAPCYPNGLHIAIEGPLVSRPYVAMTAAVMDAFGARVAVHGDTAVEVAAGGYRAGRYEIEPDASAASYMFAAAALTGGRVQVRGLGRRTLQGDLGFVEVLGRMGADVDIGDDRVEVRGAGALRGIDVDLSDLPDMAPTVAVVAAFAEGPTTVRGVGFIRHHETDRIAAVVAELGRCGIEATELDDGFVVHPGRPRPAVVHTYDDHRMAMSFALLGLVADGIEIADPGCVAKTFPDYFEVLEGLRVT